MKKKYYTILIIFIILSLFINSLPTYAYSNNDNDDVAIQIETIDPLNDTGSHSFRYTDWYYKPSSYSELVSWYQDLEALYPEYIHVFKANDLYNTGQATGGYDLYYVRITNESLGLEKPEVLFVGSPHGDETVGTIGMYWFLEWFTRKTFTDEPSEDYSKEWLNWLVNNREIYFVISQNPYGFDYNQRRDANNWDLNREADYDGPGTPTGGIWASENGKALYRFVNNHTIRVGCDFHGGIRLLLYPWAGTHTSVYGTSPLSGQTYSAAPPDFYFYDSSSLRLGSYMGNPGGDGYLNQYTTGTIDSMIWYTVNGGIAPWGYGADIEKNPVEAPYVEGAYPGAGILWHSPEMSTTKNPAQSTFGNDTIPGWGWEVRRYILHQTDLAQPYVRWQSGTIEHGGQVAAGEPFQLRWQVNGSLVVDHTFVQYGSDPDPIYNYEYSTPDHDGNADTYVGGTGWDDAYEGNTNGVVYTETISITTPGEYYFVAKAQVDQIYGEILAPDVYGDNPYLRLVKERTNASYYESLEGTDGLEEIFGHVWWYSPIIHVTVGPPLPDAYFTWEDADGLGPGTLIMFDASLSTAEDIVLYEWDWTSDGTFDHNDTSPFASYDHGDNNSYLCTLRITDNLGQTDTFTDMVQANVFLDVNQNEFDRGFRLMPGWDAYQEFIPGYETLSRIELYMTKSGSPTSDVTVQIRENNADGALVFEGVISPGDVSTSFPSYVWISIDTDVPVTPGDTYVVILLSPADGAGTHHNLQWAWCDSYPAGSDGPYENGWFYFRKDDSTSWSFVRDWDFTFRTFGFV